MSAANAARLQTIARTLRAGARNVLRHLPGERPRAVVVEIEGAILPRAERPRFFGLPLRPPGVAVTPSMEAIGEALDDVCRAPWIERVVFRVHDLRVDAATAFALRRRVAAVRAAGKHTVAYLPEIDWQSYYVASAAAEIAVPESADIGLRGLGLSVTFMRDALAKIGVRFEKLAIDEYKSAFDELVLQEMSAAQREQLEALLDRFYAHHLAAIAEHARVDIERARALVDEGITSAEQARAAGLVDRVAYEDEIIDASHRPLAAARRFIPARSPSLGKRVAMIAVTGAIVTGKSRSMPIPIPGAGGRTAGSETVAAALRTARADEVTAAVVLYVDSGGGSALASDLIWREVERLREKKPVVAVMGQVAASGGYYVLAPASRVFCAPTTITGSIGVLTGKLVLEDLYARLGLHAERIARGQHALLLDPTRPLGDGERALLQRANAEIYDRFVARVAAGRRLSVDRVREIGRGRIWSGVDAVEIGLADEIGDLDAGVACAKALAGLGPDAPVWDVPAPEELVLPSADPEVMLAAILPLSRETSWLMLPARIRVG